MAVEHASARRARSGAIDSEHDRADRHRFDEVAVADVEVEDAAAGLEQFVDLLAEPREVRRVERRLDLGVPHPVVPAHPDDRTRRATKKPLVPWTCGSVSRNSGRDGMRERRPLLAERLDVAGRSRRRPLRTRPGSACRRSRGSCLPAGRAPRRSRRSASWRSGSGVARQRRSGRCARTPRPEHGASTSARSKPSSSGGSAVPSASTTVTSERPHRREVLAQLARAVPGRSRPPSPRRAVAPSCRRAQRRGRARARRPARRRRVAASCEPRLCGQIRPARDQRPRRRARPGTRRGRRSPPLRPEARRARDGRRSRAARSSRASARARRPRRARARTSRGSSRDTTPSAARRAASRGAAGSRRRAAASRRS